MKKIAGTQLSSEIFNMGFKVVRYVSEFCAPALPS
jgi:hypothetical protein